MIFKTEIRRAVLTLGGCLLVAFVWLAISLANREWDHAILVLCGIVIGVLASAGVFAWATWREWRKLQRGDLPKEFRG